VIREERLAMNRTVGALVRKDVTMSDSEMWHFLGSHCMGVLATLSGGGHPHMVSISYAVRHRSLILTSYAKAQKVANLRRDPRASFLVEVRTPYSDVRGVLIRSAVEITRDAGLVRLAMEEVFDAYDRVDPVMAAANPRIDIAQKAEKRVMLTLDVAQVVTWDHTRLGAGQY
jgi:general stress protein 26